MADVHIHAAGLYLFYLYPRAILRLTCTDLSSDTHLILAFALDLPNLFALREQITALVRYHGLPLYEVILLSGLPGAGKDSYIKKHLPGLPVISLDDIRVKMNIDPTDKTGNGHVIQAAKEQARVFLRSKTHFIWNATNSTPSMRTQLVELFTVPAAVLEKLAWKLELPAPWEAHEVVYCV